MTNILQQAEMLKDVSDQRIQQEMQRPTGQFPLYLVSSEAKRRADLRQRFKAEQSGPPPQTTVQQDLMAALAGQVPPTTQPISPNRAVAPGQGPGLPLNPQGTLPTGVPLPPPQQGFAHGGIVRGFQDGGLTARGLGQNPSFFTQADRFFMTPRARAMDVLNARRDLSSQAVEDDYAPYSTPRAKVTLGLKEGEAWQMPKTAAQRRAQDIRTPEQLTFAKTADPGAVVYGPRGFEDPFDPNATPAPISSPVQQVYDDELPGIYTAGLHTPPPIAASRSTALSGLGGLGITRPTFESPVAGPDLTVYDNDQTFGDIADQRTADLMEERGEPYKKFADLMAKRSEDIGDAEGMNKWLAVARAGLATAGGTSQYALENIGKGAGAGLDEYISGRKDIQARRDKNLALNVQLTGLQESLKDRMAQLGMQHARGEISTGEFNIKAAQTNAQIQNAGIEARNLAKTRLYEAQVGEAQAIRTSEEKVLDRASLKERVEITAGAPSKEQKISKALAGMEKDSEEYKHLKRISDPLTAYEAKKKLRQENLFQSVIKVQQIDLSDPKLSTADKEGLLLAYMRTPGADPTYIPLFRAQLGLSPTGGGGASRGKKLKITQKPEPGQGT